MKHREHLKNFGNGNVSSTTKVSQLSLVDVATMAVQAELSSRKGCARCSSSLLHAGRGRFLTQCILRFSGLPAAVDVCSRAQLSCRGASTRTAHFSTLRATPLFRVVLPSSPFLSWRDPPAPGTLSSPSFTVPLLYSSTNVTGSFVVHL